MTHWRPLRSLARRARCLAGFHRWAFAYAPTHAATPPLYQPETFCLYCLRRFA